jgi:ATP/maltotriose-dependent transcriptional regulator MalT
MSWPLVGRDRELELARSLLGEGSRGGLVVAGPAGVGKTRLASEVAALAEEVGCAVEWVRATRSTASIPLGAFASVLPAAAEPGAALLAHARHALAERAGDSRLALCVDDGHLLDDASAGLVHQLVASGEAFALVTIRRGEAAPDAMRSLWKDELCELLELGELSRPEVERLVGEALGGPVDGRTANMLWEQTRGNALFLRELVLLGVERGALAEAGGVWGWNGDVSGGLRLGELVGARLHDLDPAALETLEVIAVGAPLEVELLDERETAAVEVLEAWEIVERRVDGRRRYVDVAHPLHGEVMRAELPRTRSEAIQRRLADAIEALGARRRGDVLRLAAWRLAAGGEHGPELFERAAAHALALLDWPLAIRLAEAGLAAGGGFAARLALGQALAGAGHAEEAERELAMLEPAAETELAAVAIARARNLFWGLDRTAEASEVLVHAERAIGDDDLRAELVALRARFMASRGLSPDAVEASRALVESPDVAERARLRAAIALVEALAMTGRGIEAAGIAAEWLPVAERHREALPLAEPQLVGDRALSLWISGELVEATEIATANYEADLARGSVQPSAVAAIEVGIAWLSRGRVRTALRWLRESAALLRGADTIGMRPWALAMMVQAAAQAGDASLAREALDEMEAAPLRGNLAVPDIEMGLARAWAAAVEGELSRARELAAAVADLAEERGQHGYTARALHELARLGGAAEAAPRLRALAATPDAEAEAERPTGATPEADAAAHGERPAGGPPEATVEGPFALAAAAHAAALAAGDGAALLEAAERLADLDALLVAAEAAAAASAAYRDEGREASARSAAGRSAALLAPCEGARPPTLVDTELAGELTPREREIAMLAARGLSSREIADRLVVSVRTVDNHLQRAYRKLGISSREELAELLTPVD